VTIQEVIDRGGELIAFSEVIAKMQVKPRNKFKNLNEEELYDLIEKAVQSADIPNKNAKKNNQRHCFSLARQDKIRARLSSTLPAARQNNDF
jgi:hypothetical protein